MPVLALDTSADISVSLVEVPDLDAAPRVLARRRAAEPRRHAELLAPLVADVLAEAGVDRSAVETVVAGTGPAPFTGLRAGLVTARTLALALDVPVLGVCSLDALAAQAWWDGVVPVDREVVVLTDARRREVYGARYRGRPVGERPGADRRPVPDVETVQGPFVDHAEALAASGTLDGAALVGPAAATTGREPAGDVTAVDPAVLAVLALRRRAAGRPTPTEPLYLRRPDVTPSATRKRATG